MFVLNKVPWKKEAFEAFVCAQTLDVGQAVGCIRPEAESRSTQVEREFANNYLLAQSSQVRVDLFRSEEDLRATFDQDRRKGQDRHDVPSWFHG